MQKVKLKLWHPILGIREFNETHAHRLMSIPDNRRGGWEWYKDQDAKAEPSSTQSNAAESTGDTTDTEGGKKSKKARNTKSSTSAK